MDLSEIEISFEYSGSDEGQRKEILRNVRTIVVTPLGTCPLYRHFGLNTTYLDFPLPIAENLMAVEMIEAIERWEPRVQVKDIFFTAELEGKLKAKVVIAGG